MTATTRRRRNRRRRKVVQWANRFGWLVFVTTVTALCALIITFAATGQL
ncbi:hypothetical protein OG711_21770 [Streptomyces uncialis]|nr:hypothetical protein [Streptomyces uncialis]